MNKQLSPETKQGIVLGLFVGLILNILSSVFNIPNYAQLLLLTLIATTNLINRMNIQIVGIVLLVLGVLDVLNGKDAFWVIWGLILLGLPWLKDLLRMVGIMG